MDFASYGQHCIQPFPPMGNLAISPSLHLSKINTMSNAKARVDVDSCACLLSNGSVRHNVHLSALPFLQWQEKALAWVYLSARASCLLEYVTCASQN